MSLPLFERFLAPEAMGEVFSDEALVQHMLDFEAALARAQAGCGLLPAAAATHIVACCRVADFDIPALAAAGRRAGSLAIPLVQGLKEAVGRKDPAAVHCVHLGCTSQDVLDTAMVLATREALQLIDAGLGELIAMLFGLAERHLRTPVLARTLMQPAQPSSFGLKCINWAAPLVRARKHLLAQAQASLQLQLGGAVGTLAAMAPHGPAVREAMAKALQLQASSGCWHTQRDDWVRLGLAVAVLCGSLAKLATDLALMSQAEVGELQEEQGGGSTAMPHKHNPVGAMLALANARRVPARAAALLACMDQEHERGLGNWQAEMAEWPWLWISAHAALAALCGAMSGLRVDTASMLANIGALPEPVKLEQGVHQAAALAAQQLAELREDNH